MGELSKKLGILGEDIAANHLAGLGYKVIDRNFRSLHGEVDIVAEDGETLVFIEVKNYSFRSYGSPYSAIVRSKKESIVHAARTYLYRNRVADKACRFDVMAIYWDVEGGRKIELIKDAFRIG